MAKKMADGSGTPSTLNLQLELGWKYSPENMNAGSPMTDLANNLEETCMVDTPKRRISWSSTGSTSPCRPQLLSFKDYSFYDSPPCDSPSVFTERLPPTNSREHNAVTTRPRSMLQRLHSVPSPKLRLFSEQEGLQRTESCSSWHSPLMSFAGDKISEDDSSNSWDSGIDKEEVNSVFNASSKLDFKFMEPVGIAPRRLRTVYEMTSPVKSDAARLPLSPISLVTVQPSCSKQACATDLFGKRVSDTFSSDDDGFLDEMDSDRRSEDRTMPFGISQLITGKIPLNSPSPKQNSVNNENADTPKLIPGKSCIRGLFGGKRGNSDSDPKPAHKRADSHRDTPSPIQSKRRKSMSFCYRQMENRPRPEDTSPLPKRSPLMRCHSENEATIMRAVQRSDQEPNLIGDFSRPYLLPLMKGKHQDLNCVSHQTMVRLVSGEFENEIEKFLIVDCRYPYEYDGGHIKGALNIYTKEGILQEFLMNPLKTTESDKRLVIVFHCEFSSERGPNLSRFLRNKDREVNKECYPQLYYPEIYLLEGGYKSFFENHRPMCEPQEYKPMLHKDHQKDMVHFRTKSKSWNGDKCGRHGSRLGLKL